MRLLAVAVSCLSVACGGDAPAPCAGPALDKGPWTMRMTASGASVLWETTAAGCAEVGVTPEAGGAETIVKGASVPTTVQTTYGVAEGSKWPDLAGTYYVATVDVSGLEPGACYRYRVRQNGAPDATGRFCTSRPSGTPFTFMAIGDTNPILGKTLPVLDHVLPAMPDFTTHMGDIQYYSSGGETWAYWFAHMQPLMSSGPFFPAVGNHEGETQYNPTEMADYYDRLFHQPSPDGTPYYYRFESGGVWFHTLDTEAPYDAASPQYQWLEQSLADATMQPGFRFNVVYMHRNLYTCGDSDPQVDRRMELAPSFGAYKVRLVLSGHMHGYERFEVGDITYVTTAGGGGLIGDVNKNVPNYPDDCKLRVASGPWYHAMLFDVAPDGSGTMLHGRAIDGTGAVLDEFTKHID